LHQFLNPKFWNMDISFLFIIVCLIGLCAIITLSLGGERKLDTQKKTTIVVVSVLFSVIPLTLIFKKVGSFQYVSDGNTTLKSTIEKVDSSTYIQYIYENVNDSVK